MYSSSRKIRLGRHLTFLWLPGLSKIYVPPESGPTPVLPSVPLLVQWIGVGRLRARSECRCPPLKQCKWLETEKGVPSQTQYSLVSVHFSGEIKDRVSGRSETSFLNPRDAKGEQPEDGRTDGTWNEWSNRFDVPPSPHGRPRGVGFIPWKF